MLTMTKTAVSDAAKFLRQALATDGIEIKHVAALNAIAAAMGFSDPNAMTAALKDGPILLLASGELPPSSAESDSRSKSNCIKFETGPAALRLEAYLREKRSIDVTTLAAINYVHECLGCFYEDEGDNESPFGENSEDIERLLAYYNTVADANGIGISSWSILEVSDLEADHPYTGATTLQHKMHWGPHPVEVPITGSRWLDLWKAADRAIEESTDEHHHFIERFVQEGTTLSLVTGS